MQTIIQCYAPINDSEEDNTDTFYEQLQTEIATAPRHDILIVIGDMNAKVGSENYGIDRAMGKYGCGIMNDNVERLVDLCSAHNSYLKNLWNTISDCRHHQEFLHQLQMQCRKQRHPIRSENRRAT